MSFDDLFKKAAQNGGFYYSSFTPKRSNFLKIIAIFIILNFLINGCSLIFNPWSNYYDYWREPYYESDTRAS